MHVAIRPARRGLLQIYRTLTKTEGPRLEGKLKRWTDEKELGSISNSMDPSSCDTWDMPTWGPRYRPHTDLIMLPTTLSATHGPYTDHILTMLPATLPSTYRPCYRPHTVSTTYRPNWPCLPTMFPDHVTDLIPTTYRARTDHVYRPHTVHVIDHMQTSSTCK